MSSTALADPGEALEAAVDLVDERFGEQVDPDELYRAAIDGLAHRLDELLKTEGNQVLSEEEHRRVQAWLRGERTGIGVEFSILPGVGLRLTEVFEGSPGSNGGLVTGDLVVGIDDHPLTGQPGGTIAHLIRSSSGKQITLDVQRANEGLRRIQVHRGAYQLHGIRLISETPVPMVRLPFFGTGSADELATLLQDVASADAVLFDMRDNQGGLMAEAMRAADLFLDPDSLMAHLLAADGTTTETHATKPRQFHGRVVLLVNHGTTGPAEAFAATLRDHGVATLVGSPTRGVSALPAFYPLGDGLVLQLMDSSLRSPTGLDWSGGGLAPDLRVDPVAMPLPGGGGGPAPDLQRDAALQLLKSR